MVIRLNEEADETGFDDRLGDDDIEKGQIKFSQRKLYGRGDELEKLNSVYSRLCEQPHQAQVFFLSGYSGIGKSAVVTEFTKQLKTQSTSPCFISGKYDELQNASDPYSAIADALNRFCSTIANGNTEESEQIQDQIRKAVGDNCDVLTDIIKDLSKVTGQQKKDSPKKENSLCKLKHAFLNFMKGLCTQQHPLIMFLDDLQWVDHGSLELLSTLLSDKTLQHFMFVGAFRSNEVDQDHPLRLLISDVQKQTEIEEMDMSDLSLEDIGEFIGDSLKLDAEEVRPLTEAVYNKTLGNIFFTRQALEELVRKNGLYYDVMIFQWQWNLSNIELEDLLSDDVVEMVKSKIEHLPDTLQQALTDASFIRSTFDLETLKVVLAAGGYSVSLQELAKMLDKAVFAGLLLNCVGTQEYTFAHDRIQEAAKLFVLGDDRYELCFRVANVLVDRSSSSAGEDWMLFTAVHHLNSLPTHYLDEDAQNARTRLARLNLRAAKRSIDKSAFSKAVESLRSGIDCLDRETQWQEQYSLCLELYNHLMETEVLLGNHDLAQTAVDQVLENTLLVDKCLAQFYYTEIITLKKDRNYDLAAQKCVEFLASHGVNIPTNPGEARMIKEKMKLRSAMRKRSLLDLLGSPQMDDYSVAIMRLLEQLSLCSVYTNERMCMAVSLISQRLSFEGGISEHLPVILSRHAIVLRKQGKLSEAFKIGEAAQEMVNKLCKGSSWVKCINATAGCILHLRRPFNETIEVFKEIHRVGFSCGEIEWGCMGGMMVALCNFCSGRPMNNLFEAKLILFEEESQRFGQPPSVTVTFSIFRQFLINIQGKGNDNPAVLTGKALDEDQALGQFDGNTYKQTLRDISIFRLILAYVFIDLSTCEVMIKRLDPYPEFDFPIARQHLRDTFMGLGAFLLASARQGKEKKKYMKLGRQKLQLYQKRAKNGSENAQPVLMCLQAEERPTRANYDKAISVCSSYHLLHLEAIMSERCGLYLLNHKKQELAESYLMKAFWLFCDWGALGKVNELRQQYGFLKGVRRQKGTQQEEVSISPHTNGRSSSFHDDTSVSKTLGTRSVSSLSKTVGNSSMFSTS